MLDDLYESGGIELDEYNVKERRTEIAADAETHGLRPGTRSGMSEQGLPAAGERGADNRKRNVLITVAALPVARPLCSVGLGSGGIRRNPWRTGRGQRVRSRGHRAETGPGLPPAKPGRRRNKALGPKGESSAVGLLGVLVPAVP